MQFSFQERPEHSYESPPLSCRGLNHFCMWQWSPYRALKSGSGCRIRTYGAVTPYWLATSCNRPLCQSAIIKNCCGVEPHSIYCLGQLSQPCRYDRRALVNRSLILDHSQIIWWVALDSNQRRAFARRIKSPMFLTTQPAAHCYSGAYQRMLSSIHERIDQKYW